MFESGDNVRIIVHVDHDTHRITMPPAPGQLVCPKREEFPTGRKQQYLVGCFGMKCGQQFVPFLEGKSSVGRLGIDIHATAGKGDVGFCNHWTLEISVSKPVRIYHLMPIGQLIYFEIQGEVDTLYSQKSSAKYNSRSPLPMESMMWKNDF